MELFIAMVITIVVYAVVTVIALRDIRRIRRLSSDAYADASADDDARTTPKPRVSLPSDSSVYTFNTDSELKAEEWEMLFNAGWEFVTSNTETYTDYDGCYPDASEFTGTCWHYVFRNKQSADGE